MAVCATCRQTNIRPSQHDCPGPQYADIVFTRHRGHGVTITHAPPHARLAVHVLTDRNAYLYMQGPDRIVFADQVAYRITGYTDGQLELELVEDWRPAATAEPKCAICLTPVSEHEGRICQRPPLSDEEASAVAS